MVQATIVLPLEGALVPAAHNLCQISLCEASC